MTHFMQEMTWKEYASCADKIVILPIGATEQHGEHLPLCVDAVLAEGFSLKLAEQIDGIIMPTLRYGYKSKPMSGGGPLFPGTVDLNGETVIKLVYDVLTEIIRDGFTKILIMNAHFENEAFIVEAMDLVTRDTNGIAKILETNWWDPMPSHIIDQVFDEIPFPGWALEHAAVTETSLMLYFKPELVHMDRITDTKNAEYMPYYRYPICKSDIPETGTLASAASSSFERGKLIVDSVLHELVRICEKEFNK
ncbi:creatininase [Clostridium polynesiense]|uniref:creatininase n=1 Tax=Clostridium polynesiense TaxID=1325933 RepID=UPI000A5D1A62|nr:creatininase [Clostridium polynesiense]